MFDRRRLLGASLAATALSASGIRIAFASPVTDKRLVVAILRGAVDGLTAVPPIGDPDYAKIRGSLAIAQTAALPLDTTFGLHPAFAQLHEMWVAKQLVVFHAIASPYRERSHFDGQAALETGGAKPDGFRDGWLNRALPGAGLADNGRALAVAETAPLILLGKSRAATWMPEILPSADEDFLERVRALYAHDPILGRSLSQALKTEASARAAMDDPSTAPSAAPVAGAMTENTGMAMNGQRPAAGLASLTALASGAGKLLAAPDGPRVAVLDFSGWDTHVAEGTTDGTLARRIAALDAALGALKTALGPTWKDTAVIVATEFGRTVAPNGSGGTDHGTGTVAFLLGGSVAGGQVRATWGGLKPAELYQARDLQPHADIRSLFKAGLTDHLTVPRKDLEKTVFPDSSASPPMQGLFVA
ncbi:MAG TPA: DUF1501 domain-containing protein [Rhizomicrobium sp.]|jgi:uncharacterized protein (DUF1501 family)